MSRSRQVRWRTVISTVPLAALSALPTLACPACWPAYVGLLGSLGLGFVDYMPYLFPLTAVFILIALVSIVIQCRRASAYLPLLLALIGIGIMGVERASMDSATVRYIGVAMVVVSSLWAGRQERSAHDE